MTGALDSPNSHQSTLLCNLCASCSCIVAAALAMAGPLASLQPACARIASPALPFNATTTQLTTQPLQLAVATPRRGCHLGTGRHSGSGYGTWSNQSTHMHSLKAISNSETNSSASASDDENDLPPAGCSRVKVDLKKPLGIAFEEDEFGRMFVGEVIQGGNADKSGLVDAGDQLIATSAIVYGSEEEYQGVMVRKGMQKIRLNVRGERFETVIAAIGTHPYYVKVEMEFQKCKPVLQNSFNGSTRD
ncbi:hypothetical protein M758_1G184200 [Ceratodon purpureus]|nr:hypothetical protein M758_1G184200 [Ceratodon purpureus]